MRHEGVPRLSPASGAAASHASALYSTWSPSLQSGHQASGGSAHLAPHPWAPKPMKPGVLIITSGNLLRLSVPPFTLHTHRTRHTPCHQCIRYKHCTSFTRTFSHLCMHMQKKVHATSFRNIFTFTLDQTHPHPHSHTDRHTFLDTQAHTARARTPARAHSEQARAPGCPRTGFFWNGRSCRGTRGRHQIGRYGLWP